jgi:hypothetical protein
MWATQSCPWPGRLRACPVATSLPSLLTCTHQSVLHFCTLSFKDGYRTGVVTHPCNPSYSGGRHQQYRSLRPSG